jgi:hypothetical protein
MATYQGSAFEAGIGPAEGDVVLFAACPPPEELGFEPATGHWRKQVRRQDVQAVWEAKPIGMFRGARCMVLDDLGDRLHIGYVGHDEYQATQIGYWQVDRGVFELVAPRAEVTEITEERASYPARPARPRTPAGGPGYAGPSSAQAYQRPAGQDTGQYFLVPPFDQVEDPAFGDSVSPQGYLPVPDEISGVTLPAPAQAPLPLEAEAMRAASASRRVSAPAAATPAPPVHAPPPAQAQPPPPVHAPPPAQAQPPPPVHAPPPPAAQTAPAAQAAPAGQAAPAAAQAPPRPKAGTASVSVTQTTSAKPATPAAAATRATARNSDGHAAQSRQELASEQLFAELAALAGIPADSYAMGEEVDGALCLLETPKGFEVFHAAGGARHEVQVFSTEESACFYLFGLLASEAVRSGSLLPGAGRPV